MVTQIKRFVYLYGMDSKERTEIAQLGEFGLIERLSEKVKTYQDSTVTGIGDDAAVIRSADELMLLSSDIFMEGIHFDLSYFPLQHLGYKAVAANVSDIAAMNGVPKQITINLGLSNRFSVEAIEELYQGIGMACEMYQIDLVGGDMSSSSSGLVVSVSILGTTGSGNVVYRKGAKAGDVVCVTGDLGGAYVGLQILEREKQVFLSNPEMQPQLDQYQYVVQRQLKPEARMDIIYELQDLKVIPTSMIDISDGLVSEIFHLCKQNGLGTTIYEDQLPIDNQTYETAIEFNLDPVTCVLNGGEDYELLFTIKPDDQELLKKHADIHFIGTMTKETDKLLVSKKGQAIPLQAQGWQHFNQSTG